MIKGIKDIEKLKCENRGVKEEVIGCKQKTFENNCEIEINPFQHKLFPNHYTTP